MHGILTNIQTSSLLNTSQKALQLESDMKLTPSRWERSDCGLVSGSVVKKLQRVFNSVHHCVCVCVCVCARVCACTRVCMLTAIG